MKKPTKEQIAAEIAALKDCKTFVPHFSKFGENNLRKIDVQIEVLEGQLDTTSDEYDELSSGERDAALDAQNWLDGDADEGLAEGWEIFRNKRT